MVFRSSIKYAQKVIDHAILDKKPMCIIPNSDESDYANRYRTRIRNLHRNTTQIERETGRQETYLGFLFLQGHISEDRYVRGPFIHFPVYTLYKQEGKLPGWYIVFSDDKKPILNRALLEALKKKRGFNLPVC